MRNPNLELPEQQKTVAPTVTQPKVQQNKSTVKPNLPELPKQGSTRKAQYATKVETIPYNANTNPYAAQVYQLGMQIGKYGANDKLANQFRSAYLNYQNTQSNPYSPYYNPYSKATNYKAIEGLRSYGYDPDQMSDDQIRMLTVGKRTTATGYDAAAPLTSGKSTDAQDVAYWAQEYLQAQDTTLKAEKELADLGKDIEYYVSKGYSDKQIYDAVSSKYSTLNSMMSKKAEGNAVLLNRAVNFNGDDTIYGMIWSARNGGSVGDYGLDAAAYYSKIGNTYKPDEGYTRRHDATNKDTYNPYADGTTLNLGDKYRVINFSREWLQEHRMELDDDDILKIDDAITNSENAEAEIAKLNEYIAKQLEGKTPQQQIEIYKKLADRLSDESNDWLSEQGYKTLSKMESKRTSGNPLALGYGVDFNLKDTINDLRARGEAINGEIKTEEARQYAEKRWANERKKYANDDEALVKAAESLISDLQSNEQFEGADIESVVSGIQNDVHGARLKVDKTAQTKARVEEIRASGATLGERMASGNYSEAQLKEKTKQYLRGEDVGEDWKALMGRTFRSLLFATDNTDYGQLNAALNGLDYSTGVKLIGGAVQELADAGDATKGDVIDRIMRGTGVTSLAAAMDQQNWKNVLGEDAYKALTRVKDAFDNGIITSDQYVDYIYDLALTVDEAIQKETDPAEYLQNSMFGDFDYQRLDPVIVEQRQQREELMAELGKQEKASIAQMIQTAENNVANGDATDQDIAIVQSYKTMDLGTAFQSAPALSRQYDFQKLDITERVHEDMTTKLIQAFGRDAVKEWVKDSPTGFTGKLLDSNASQIAEIAMEYFADDYKKAAMCGMSIEEYYEAFPTRKPDEAKMQEIIAGAVNTYNRNWGQVWLDVDNIIRDNEQAATMPMYVPRPRSIEDVWDAASAIGDARDKYISDVYSSEAGKADAAAVATVEAEANAKENKIPVWTAAYLAGKLGVLSFEQGPLKAFSGLVTYMADDELEAYNRAHYLNDPVAYRKKLEETIDNGIADPQLAASYKELLNTYDGDVFNIQLNFLDQGIQDMLYSIQSNARQTQEYIDENASPFMANAINSTSNLLMNGMNLGFTALLTWAGVDPMTATTLIYGVPEAGEMMERLNSAGVDTNTSRAAGLITALGVGALEKIMNFDVYIENFGRKAFDAVATKTGFKALAQHIKPSSLLARAGKSVVKAATVTGGGEALQEGTEALLNWIVESSAETWNGYGFTFDERWRENLENANIPESMKQGYIQGIGLGAIANLGGRFLGFVSNIARNRRALAGPVSTTSTEQVNQLLEEARAEAEEQAPESQKMAMDIIENKAEPTDENMAALLDQYAKDLSDPRVVKLFEDQAAMAEAQEQVVSDILGNPNNAYMKGMQAYADGIKEAQTEVDNLKAKLEQEQQAIETNGQTLIDLQAFVQADPANKEKAQRYTDYLAESRQVIEQHDATLEQYGKAQQALEQAQRDYNNASVAYTDGVYLAAYQMAKTKRTRIIQAEAVAERLEKEADALYQNTVTKASDALKDAKAALKEAKIAPLDRAQHRAAMAKAERQITRAEQKVDTALESPKLALAQAKADFARLTVKQMSAHHLSMDDAAAYVQERDRLKTVIAELEGVVRNAKVGNVATDADWSIMAGITMMAENPRGTTGYIRGQNLVNMAAAENRFHNLPADATSEQIAQARAEMEEAQRIYKESVANGDQAVEQMGEQTEQTTEATQAAEAQPAEATEAATSEQAVSQTNTAPQNTEERQYYHGTKVTEDLYVQDGAKKVKVESPQTVLKKLSKELKVPTYVVGNKKILPVYNRVARLVLKNVNMVNDLAKGLHEIGHFVQDKTGFQLEMTQGIKDMVEELRSGVDYDLGTMEDEAFAEFFTTYMASRNKAVEIAGEDNVRNFEQTLRDNKLFKPISQAAAKVANYINASADEQLNARIVNRSDAVKNSKNKDIYGKIALRSNHAMAAVPFDRKVGATGYNMRRAMEYMVWQKRSTQQILEGNLITPDHRVIDMGLNELFDSNGINADNINDLFLLRTALYSKERAKQGKGFLGNFSEKSVDAIIEKYSHLMKANDAFSQWWQKFTHAWLVDTGPVTEEQWTDWAEKYPNYMPTFRELNGSLVDVEFDPSNKPSKGGWTFHEATENDLNIISPLDTIPEQISAIVTRVAQLEVAQKWDEMYQANKQYGLGEFAREIAPEVAEGENGMEIIMAPRPGGQQRAGVLTVQRKDGTKVAYDFTGGNMLLYRAITTAGPEAAPAIIRAIGSMGRIISQTTTALNPKFAGRNALRDQPQSFEQGTYTKTGTYIEGLPKWFASLARVAKTNVGDVPVLGTVLEKTGTLDKIKPSEVVQEYERMGGGEWSMADTTRVRNREEIRRGYIPGYKGDNVAHKIGYYSDKAFHVVTAQELNGWIEEASRAAEYGSDAYDRTTEEGRRLAFLMSQENTVNFGKFGLGKTYSILKNFVLFYNPTIQGLEQARETLVTAFDNEAPAEERQRARTIIAKRALNMGLLAGFQTAMRHLFFNDEDKEHYDQLGQDYKVMNLIFPTSWVKGLASVFGANFPAMEGERRWVRIPIGQSVIDQALYSGFTAAMNNLDGIDSTSINLLDAAGKLLHDNMPIDPFQFGGWDEWLNGMASSTVLGIPVSVATNRTWANSYIVPEYMKDYYVTEQIYEDTPSIFRYMSQALTTVGIKISPIALQYVAEQYTGYFGSILIPAMSPDQGTGAMTPWRNIVTELKRSFTIDDLTSNDIMNTYYDMIDKVGVMADWDNKGYLPVFMDQSADPEDAQRAAKDFQKQIKGLQKELKEVNATIKEIGSDENLTPAERAIQKKEYQQERLNIMMEINEMGGEWMRQWGSKSVLAKIIGY